MKTITKHIITDLLILAVMGALTGLIAKDVFGIRMRGWYPSDFHTIGYQRTLPETVPMKEALIWVIGAPVLTLLIFWIFVDKIFTDSFDGQGVEGEELTEMDVLDQQYALLGNDHDQCVSEQLLPTPVPTPHSSSQSVSDIINTDQANLVASVEGLNSDGKAMVGIKSSSGVNSTPKALVRPYPINWGTVVIPGQSPRGRKLRFALYQFYSLCFVLVLSLFVCNSIKNIVGSLRPDFLSCCDPDYSVAGLVIGPNGWIDHKYESIVCRGSHKEVLEAHKSFPSGHSSSAMAASLFTAILLYKRFWNRGQRHVGMTFTPFLIIGSILVAFCIAATRHIDNRHRFADISIGLVLGAICACATLWLQPFTPSYECDGSITTERNHSLQQKKINWVDDGF